MPRVGRDQSVQAALLFDHRPALWSPLEPGSSRARPLPLRYGSATGVSHWGSTSQARAWPQPHTLWPATASRGAPPRSPPPASAFRPSPSLCRADFLSFFLFLLVFSSHQNLSFDGMKWDEFLQITLWSAGRFYKYVFRNCSRGKGYHQDLAVATSEGFNHEKLPLWGGGTSYLLKKILVTFWNIVI